MGTFCYENVRSKMVNSNVFVKIGKPQYPGSQYPVTTGQTQQPQSGQYPQYGSGPNSIPSGSKFPPPFPGASAPTGELCNAPNVLCVSKSACNQGVLTQNGVPGRAGVSTIHKPLLYRALNH